jgi:hypothetical protein
MVPISPEPESKTRRIPISFASGHARDSIAALPDLQEAGRLSIAGGRSRTADDADHVIVSGLLFNRSKNATLWQTDVLSAILDRAAL